MFIILVYMLIAHSFVSLLTVLILYRKYANETNGGQIILYINAFASNGSDNVTTSGCDTPSISIKMPFRCWAARTYTDITFQQCAFYVGVRTAVKFVEGERLVLQQVQRSDMGGYLCIASNGIPPSVSKRFDVQVMCKCLHIQFVGWFVGWVAPPCAMSWR